MTWPAGDLRIAFVSAPGGSVFMEEILAAVSAEVAATGTRSFCHRGYLAEVAEAGTRFVVVPHEYFVLAPEESPDLYAATIGFGVEHPGTQTFATAVDVATRLGAQFQISRDAVAELATRGLAADHFTLGYVAGWDRWRQQDCERPVDVAYLGTADQRRVGLLAGFADDLVGLECELLIPPHEPMTRARPDFLPSERKWTLLAGSKVLVNLHRETKTGFEWVRCLEAMINGCVVVTEPSTDLGPLVPGEHLIVAATARVGAVARAVVRDNALRDRIAANAYQLCRTELDMTTSVRRLVQVASALPARFMGVASPARPDDARVPAENVDAPLAVWIPQLTDLPAGGLLTVDGAATVSDDAARTTVWPGNKGRLKPALVDVVCVRAPGDGPLGITTASLLDDAGIAAIHVAESAGASPAPPTTGVALDTFLSSDLAMSRGRARNLLVEHTTADLLCFLDSGDAVLGNSLGRLVGLMADDASLDICFAMATLGRHQLVNALVPEQRRLLTRAYLTRGFVVRRPWLERLGGFVEAPDLDTFVDHVFWQASVEHGAKIRLARTIGFALWPRRAQPPAA